MMGAPRRPGGQAANRRRGGAMGTGSNAQLAKALLGGIKQIVGTPTRPQPKRRPRRRNPVLTNAGLRSIQRGSQKKEAMFQGGSIRPMSFAPRGQGYYDAFVMRPEAALVSLATGPSTPIMGFKHTLLNGRAGLIDAHVPVAQVPIFPQLSATPDGSPGLITDNSTLIVLNVGSSDMTIGRVYNLQSTIVPGAVIDVNNPGASLTEISVNQHDIDIPQFAELGPTVSSDYVDSDHLTADNIRDHSTGRIESLPLRLSVRLKNITESIAVGGEVRWMRYNGGLNVGQERSLVLGQVQQPLNLINDTMDVQTYVDITTMMKDTLRSHVVGSKDLEIDSHQMNTYPSDSVRSATFAKDTSFNEACLQPKFCTMLILIENFRSSQNGFGNTFTLQTSAQRTARFQPGTIHYSKQITHQHSPGALAQHAAVEESKPPSIIPKMIQSAAQNPAVQQFAGGLAKTAARTALQRGMQSGLASKIAGADFLEAALPILGMI